MPPPTPSAVYEKSIYPKVYLQRNDQLTKHPGTVLSEYNVESVNGKKLTKKLEVAGVNVEFLEHNLVSKGLMIASSA